MVIRAFLWHKHKRSSPLGNFRPKLSQKLHERFKQLYGLLAVGQVADREKFGPVVHEILYYNFTMPTNIKDQVATALEQSLIFCISTSERAKYLSPGLLCYLFAHVQRTCFSTFVHTAWQGGIENRYTIDDRHAKVTTQAKDDSDEEEGDEEEEEGLNKTSARTAEDEIDDAQEDIELRSFHDQQDQGCSPGSDFFEQIGEDSVEVVASLDDSAMEIVPDRPEEDEVKRLSAQAPCIPIFERN